MDEVDQSAPAVEQSQPQPTPPPPTVKSSRWLKIAIVGGAVGLVLVLTGVVIYLVATQKSAPKPVACTQEAKQCSDGSYASRIGPNCIFAPCPTPAPDITADWKTYTHLDSSFQIKYPPSWNYAVKPLDPGVI